MPQRVVIIVANPGTASTTGWPVGFWASELFHPWQAFNEEGIEVTVASPDGGEVTLDALSDPDDPSGYSKDDQISRDFLSREDVSEQLKNTTAAASINHEAFDAIVVAGGQSPMFTFESATALHTLFQSFLNAGKPSATLCHGSCLLLYLKDESGEPAIEGRHITGFSNAEEDVVDNMVGQQVMPFRIESEARRLGARFEQAPVFSSFAIRDGNLISGQQQNSGARVAELVLGALQERASLSKKLAFIGSGKVGGALAARFADVGYHVTIAARNPESETTKAALSRHSALKVADVGSAVAAADIIFLAVPFAAAENALKQRDAFSGKIVVDCTNPVGAGLTHGLESVRGGSEVIAELVPEAHVVKAFTVYGYENFEDTDYSAYSPLRPVMPVCGEDATSKALVCGLANSLGFEAVDVGNLSSALHLEHMTLLWIKMARAQGKGAGFTWGMLRR